MLKCWAWTGNIVVEFLFFSLLFNVSTSDFYVFDFAHKNEGKLITSSSINNSERVTKSFTEYWEGELRWHEVQKTFCALFLFSIPFGGRKTIKKLTVSRLSYILNIHLKSSICALASTQPVDEVSNRLYCPDQMSRRLKFQLFQPLTDSCQSPLSRTNPSCLRFCASFTRTSNYSRFFLLLCEIISSFVESLSRFDVGRFY